MRHGEEHLAANGCPSSSGINSDESVRQPGRVIKDEEFQGRTEASVPTSKGDVYARPLLAWHGTFVPKLFRRHKLHAVLEAANFDQSDRQAEVDFSG